MISVQQEYNQYLSANFKDQKIKSPLFFNGKFGLRFDLQVGNINSKDYFIEVIKRSTALFEASFNETNEIFLLYRRHKRKRTKIRFTNYCFKQSVIFKNKISRIRLSKNLYNKGEDDIYNVAIFKTLSRRINYKNILTAIANSDFFGRTPRLNSLNDIEIYFINITRDLIFYMYDDRGIDIIASDEETLMPLYAKFNNWILEVNRAK